MMNKNIMYTVILGSSLDSYETGGVNENHLEYHNHNVKIKTGKT